MTKSAFLSAAASVSDYFMPSAERVYGDAGTKSGRPERRDAGALDRPGATGEVHVRHMLREVRLPGLATAATLHAAAAVLTEADWLRKPDAPTGKRPRMAYPVNPKLWRRPINRWAEAFRASIRSRDTVDSVNTSPPDRTTGPPTPPPVSTVSVVSQDRAIRKMRPSAYSVTNCQCVNSVMRGECGEYRCVGMGANGQR